MSFTLLPFLYQTRTILRIPAHRTSAGIARSFHATARRTKDGTIPFDFELDKPDEDVPATEVTNRGTITPSERQIFERIFADIEARGLRPAVKGDGEPDDSSVTRSTRLIMQQAAHDAGQARSSTLSSPALLAGAAKNRAKALLRFPPPLRSAAERAIDGIKQQANPKQDNSYTPEEDESANGEWQSPAHTFSRTLELEAKRAPERSRIEGLIMSAASDFELWDILEKEVFTMPARLGIVKSAPEYDDAEASPMTEANGRRNTADSPEESSHDAEADPRPEADEIDTTSTSSNSLSDPDDSHDLSLYVHGPLYPAYLLLGLRRLDSAFSAPSSLTFSILPRIKELGLESYVLGVSTLFFNELLAIYWTRRGDLSGFLGLLEEMRHCGLYFDIRTASILNRVDNALSGLAKGIENSGFGRALMLMPEYEPSQRDRLRHWHREVDLSVEERKGDIGYMESTGMRI